MIVFINSKNEIKDVNETSDNNLIAVEMPEDNPFANWSVAKICCFKISLDAEGKYNGFTPYIDSRVIEHIERLGLSNEQNASDNAMLKSCILEMSELIYA